MDFDVKTLEGGSDGTISVSDAIFGLEPRQDLVQRVVRWQLAKRQAGTHKTKTRGEINATGKKMYKQKGTGRARHADRAAPQFRGGGKAFGPVVRSHAHDLPKKVRALGLKHALSAKARDGKIVVIAQAAADEAKTKAVREKLAGLGLTNALVVDGAERNDAFVKAAQNIPYLDLIQVAGLNVYDILRRDTLVLTKAAVESLEERFK
ncbi:50S ribosomal protein L4 [Amorphus coralli]|uniref:50S ribosomal protein L4 n=1 Tax=Amorphus coralli TaxID=340680 RepID=UPI0003786A37|nr:50S ribosomal protein L4 [Amorphus coralli]